MSCLRPVWCLLSLCVLCLPVEAGAQIIISEFRLRGPGGANDEFIEIYNASGTYTTDIPDNAGLALFNNNTGGGNPIYKLIRLSLIHSIVKESEQ